jgi:hypothetical protein
LGALKTIIAKIESDVLQVPEEVREILGHDMKIVVGTAAIVAFSAGTSYADVLRSLELIQDDLQLRLSKEKSEAAKTRKN